MAHEEGEVLTELTYQEKHELLSGLTHLKDSVENLDLPDYGDDILRIANSMEDMAETGQRIADALEALAEQGRKNEG